MNDQMNETDIIKKAQSGDEMAFEILFKRYYKEAYTLSYRWFRNRTDAEDVAQESFVRVARSLKNFKFESSFKTWLYRIVVNCCKDLVSSQIRKRKMAEDYKKHQDIQEQPGYVSQVKVAEAEKILNQLTPKAKEVFILVVLEELTHAEAAKILECSETTVSWHMHWTKKKMKELLGLRKVIV